MPRMPEDVSPAAGRGKGGSGSDRPTYEIRAKDPAKFRAMMRVAVLARLEGKSWVQAARESGIPYNTLKSWQRAPTSRYAKQWFALLEEEASKNKMTPEGEFVDDRPPPVTVEGFESPEQLADHWSIHATKIQVETMLDTKAARRERIDAAKRIQDLGGHSPINKSVVVSAPLDDPRVAKSIMAVLEEVRLLQSNPPAKLIEGESEPA